MATRKKTTAKKSATKKSTKKKPAAKKSTTKKSAKKKPATKKSAKKAPAKKTVAKKTAAKKTAKKTVAKKTVAKKASAKKTTKKASAKKTVAKKAAAKKTTKKSVAKKTTRRRSRKKTTVVRTNPALFAPLTDGEWSESLRLLTEDSRITSMAKIGRYRVVSVEALPQKPPSPSAGHRCTRVVAYDYAASQCVDALVDLEIQKVVGLSFSNTQPMLSSAEDEAAIHIALRDPDVQQKLTLGDEAQSVAHYVNTNPRFNTTRSAAVLFGANGARPRTVVVVDLLDSRVTEIVPAENW